MMLNLTTPKRLRGGLLETTVLRVETSPEHPQTLIEITISSARREMSMFCPPLGAHFPHQKMMIL
ncbi:MAG TPA: hypothetical protein VNT79_10015, partial [Phycisphaerae bacterium]|nr:hypothetical protein [Phycisphaerae bacterium]